MVQVVGPKGMEDHVEGIEGSRRRGRVPREVASHMHEAAAHVSIPRRWDVGQHRLQVGNAVLGQQHGEGGPIEDVGEREHETIGDDDRHAARVDGLHDPRAVHLVAHGAHTELAAPHVLLVNAQVP